jgi:hypothetical protein
MASKRASVLHVMQVVYAEDLIRGDEVEMRDAYIRAGLLSSQETLPETGPEQEVPPSLPQQQLEKSQLNMHVAEGRVSLAAQPTRVGN